MPHYTCSFLLISLSFPCLLKWQEMELEGRILDAEGKKSHILRKCSLKTTTTTSTFRILEDAQCISPNIHLIYCFSSQLTRSLHKSPKQVRTDFC